MRRATWATGAAAVLLLILASCARTGSAAGGPGASPVASPVGTPTGSSSAGPSTDAAVLDGRTFLSTDVVGHDLVDGTRISLSFEGEDLGLQAGCNHLFGTVDAADGRLQTSGVGGTEMGCAKDLMAQDTWLMQFFEAGPSWELDAETLTLHGDDTTITLVDREIADPDRPLEGTDWVLDGFIDGDTASSVPQGMSATMRIADGRMQFTACNHYDVAIELGSDLGVVMLTPIGEARSTAMLCEGADGEFDEHVRSVLLGETTVDIDADVLTFTAGSYGLTFRAATDTPTAPPSPAPPAVPATTPASTERSDVESSEAGPAGPLAGRTFVLTRLFTDAGGIDTRLPDATFTITFADGSAVATSQCGTHRYDNVVIGQDDTGGPGLPVDLGTPSGPACDLGTDPPGIPSGQLYFGGNPQDGFYLSTGYVAWYFEEDVS